MGPLRSGIHAPNLGQFVPDSGPVSLQGPVVTFSKRGQCGGVAFS